MNQRRPASKANRRRNTPKKPLQQQTDQVIINDLSHEGRGVAKVNQKTVFVEGALPGEQVEIRYTNHRGKFDEAIVADVIAPSADRVDPPCPHFFSCGGCQLQHMAMAAQLDHKRQLLLKTLQRIGKVTPVQCLPTISGEPEGYRRRARLGVRYLAKEDRVEIGFRAANSDRVAPLKQCLVLMAPFDNLFAELTELINGLTAKRRIPQLEVMVADGVNAINIHLLTKLQDDDRQKLHNFAEQHQLAIYSQSGDASTIEPLSGRAFHLEYSLPDFALKLAFQPGSFLQVNPVVNQQLVSHAVDLLQLTGKESVLDLFCGLGNFTLPIATKAKSVVGVEGNAKAVLLAEKNAAKNNISNSEFFVADLSKDQKKSAWGKRKYDAVLLDPPRSGAADMLKLVAYSGAKRVVYVSCHPGTLARDVGVLVREHGFSVESATPVEMFPHTSHLESVVVLVRS